MADFRFLLVGACFVYTTFHVLAQRPPPGVSQICRIYNASNVTVREIDCPPDTYCSVGPQAGRGYSLVYCTPPISRACRLQDVASTFTLQETDCPGTEICSLGPFAGSINGTEIEITFCQSAAPRPSISKRPRPPPKGPSRRDRGRGRGSDRGSERSPDIGTVGRGDRPPSPHPRYGLRRRDAHDRPEGGAPGKANRPNKDRPHRRPGTGDGRQGKGKDRPQTRRDPTSRGGPPIRGGRPGDGGHPTDDGRPAGRGEPRPIDGDDGRPAGRGERRPTGGDDGRPADRGERRPTGGDDGRPAGGVDGPPARRGERRPTGGPDGRPASRGVRR